MHITVTGISYRSAPLAVRERLALAPDAIQRVLAQASAAGLAEAVVVATCGRTELYAASPGERPDGAELSRLLAEASGEPLSSFESYLETRHDADAVLHLARVAAGLDSLVLGESEILGQIGDALEAAESAGTVGMLLIKVFHAAIRAGRRARAETKIADGAASVPAVAVRVTTRALGSLENRAVLVLGAGAMASKAVRALVHRGAGPVTVINRTLERAERLADRYAARAAGLEQLAEALRGADICITSTGAQQPIVTAADLRAGDRRAERPLVIVDMAVPRDVEPEARALPGVVYFDLDDLAARAEESVSDRRAQVPKVEAIVAEEAERALGWLQAASVLPTIASLRGRAEAIRVAELERALRKMPQLSPAERKALEAFSHSLVKKLLHDPTVSLKAEAGSPGAAELASAARRRFALELADGPGAAP
ncbi:MAG: glutamyl-tRNA reductase [Gemmatimonadales bacterium]